MNAVHWILLSSDMSHIITRHYQEKSRAKPQWDSDLPMNNSNNDHFRHFWGPQIAHVVLVSGSISSYIVSRCISIDPAQIQALLTNLC